MSYGKVEERSSSRSRSPNTARHAATFAILTDILSRSDRAPTSHTDDARPGKTRRRARRPPNLPQNVVTAMRYPASTTAWSTNVSGRDLLLYQLNAAIQGAAGL